MTEDDVLDLMEDETNKLNEAAAIAHGLRYAFKITKKGSLSLRRLRMSVPVLQLRPQ